MNISVVIPTRNRKARLLSLLGYLNGSTLLPAEVIIVDSSDEALLREDYTSFTNLSIIYIRSESSVCIQRNIGIRAASSEWIFLCDDDIEVPVTYLQSIATHIASHPEAGAVSGIVLEKENGIWAADHPLTSKKELLLKYVFGLGIWGEIKCTGFPVERIKAYYARKGNHISNSGWPVNTHLSNVYWATPVYGLGASVIKKEWLLASPYDEVLDKHGIGDNYGVAAGFPGNIHVINNAVIYHHHEQGNRLHKPLQYYRRILALDYFRRTKSSLCHVKKSSLLSSLFGNFLIYLLAGDSLMIQPSLKTFWVVLKGTNPYLEAAKRGNKVTEPQL